MGVGRSNIVGLPDSLLLLKANAIVTVVHSHSHDPESIIREADIIIAAAGQAMMLGDVDFQEAYKVARWVTPVPGGVGPMTVAMLLKNTLDGAKRVIAK